MTDLPLLDYAEQTSRLAKADGTSLDAARVAAKTADGDIRKVLWYLDTYGPATADEIADGLRMDWKSIRPRCSQARKIWGWAEKTGVRRAPLGHPTACKQNELCITEAGREVLRTAKRGEAA